MSSSRDSIWERRSTFRPEEVEERGGRQTEREGEGGTEGRRKERQGGRKRRDEGKKERGEGRGKRRVGEEEEDGGGRRRE